MAYVLANKPYVDVLHSFAEAGPAATGKNPFKQFPFVEAASGGVIFQTLAIMQHVGQGTSVWPTGPSLTRALEVGMAAYDLYQHFGAFAADDAAAKAKFEQRRVPQFFTGLDEIYGARPFAAGETPTFADCMVYEAIAWCVRRNDVCRQALEEKSSLTAFMKRFSEIPAIAAFMARQAAARASDNTL